MNINITLTEEEVRILKTILEVAIAEPGDVDRLADTLGQSYAVTEDELEGLRSKLYRE